MKLKINEHIKNGIIVTVLGGIILTFWPPVRQILLDILKNIFLFFDLIFKYLQNKHEVPLYILISMFVVILFCLQRELLFLIKKFIKNKKKMITTAYAEDEFFGLIWKWGYDSRFMPVDLKSFCPKCGENIKPTTSGYRFSSIFRCDICKYEPESIKMPLDEIILAIPGC